MHAPESFQFLCGLHAYWLHRKWPPHFNTGTACHCDNLVVLHCMSNAANGDLLHAITVHCKAVMK